VLRSRFSLSKEEAKKLLLAFRFESISQELGVFVIAKRCEGVANRINATWWDEVMQEALAVG
jgi:hypothetical protein